MKHTIFIAVSAMCVMTACTDPLENEAVIRQRDSLMAVIDTREASVNDFIESFNEVERNLDSVSRKQNIIQLNSNKSELKADQKARINEEIKAINSLMEANNKQLKELKRRLNKSDKGNAQLRKTVETLTSQLNQKYTELTQLNERLSVLNAQVAQLQTKVDTLNMQNENQKDIIMATVEELHTAYYVVGSSKELEKSNLIDKKGGLLGIGKTAKLSTNVDKSKFTKINFMQTFSIPINSKDMKLITSHPEGSYTVEKTDKTITALVISNPEKFWSVSKYLVVAN